MFGYVLPAKPEMRVMDYETYRACYCGLCKELGRRYGFFSRFLLNYDLVLLALLADALLGDEICFKNESCFANPLIKRPTMHSTAGLCLAADALVLLSWHKLQDNLLDETLPRRLALGFARPAFFGMYKKAQKRQPQLAATLSGQMQNQQALEKANCHSLDESCQPTAQMCSAIFALAAKEEKDAKILARLGMFCGQIIYLLDAAEDFEEDLNKNRYNVFALAGFTKSQTAEGAKRRCNMAAGELLLCYNLLHIKMHKEILDNIFFLGLPRAIAAAGTKKLKGNRDGQTNSL